MTTHGVLAAMVELTNAAQHHYHPPGPHLVLVHVWRACCCQQRSNSHQQHPYGCISMAQTMDHLATPLTQQQAGGADAMAQMSNMMMLCDDAV